MTDNEKKISSFKPIIDKNTKAFVVGTMPSVQSLADNQYYAHPRNHFWHIISALFNDNKPFSSFEDKKACLLKNNIGLWDALKSCHRKGSLDLNIKNAEPNDFGLYPQIQFYFFNGQMAYQFFKRFNGSLLKPDNHIVLPSTSPANAGYNFDRKLCLWREALEKQKLFVPV